MEINLLYKKRNYKRLEELFTLFRKVVTVSSIISLVVTAGLYFYFLSRESQYKTLLKTKEALLSKVVAKKNLEAKLVFVIDKTRLFADTKKNNSPYQVYLNAFQQTLPEEKREALKSFSIDKDKNMLATLDFTSSADVYAFMSSLQRPELLDYFSQLKISAVTFSPLPLNTIAVQVGGTIQKPPL